MLVGQAVLESGWSPIKIWHKEQTIYLVLEYLNQQHIYYHGMEKWQGWGVRVFKTKCDSVKEYIRLLNEHTSI